MKKKWKTSPWEIKLIFLYWSIPTVLIFVASFYMLIMFLLVDIEGLWRIPFSMLEAEYKLMPISTSLDITFTIMSIFGAYYAWRLLRGSGMARNFLEIISWLIVIYSSAFILFPELHFIELHETPTDINNPPITLVIIGWLFLLLQISILFILRRVSVKNYANIF